MDHILRNAWLGNNIGKIDGRKELKRKEKNIQAEGEYWKT